jgi:hypothetical protein
VDVDEGHMHPVLRMVSFVRHEHRTVTQVLLMPFSSRLRASAWTPRSQRPVLQLRTSIPFDDLRLEARLSWINSRPCTIRSGKANSRMLLLGDSHDLLTLVNWQLLS